MPYHARVWSGYFANTLGKDDSAARGFFSAILLSPSVSEAIASGSFGIVDGASFLLRATSSLAVSSGFAAGVPGANFTVCKRFASALTSMDLTISGKNNLIEGSDLSKFPSAAKSGLTKT